MLYVFFFCFFFQAEDGIRDRLVTGVQTCALPISALGERPAVADGSQNDEHVHDLAIMFTSTEMNTSLSLMKEYNISYFFTSSDLLPKYSAISFLAGQPD